MMNYYERKIQKYDTASMALAKLGLLIALVLMAAQAFAGGTPVTAMQAGATPCMALVLCRESTR